MTTPDPGLRRRSPKRDLAILVAVALLTYIPGLTVHGLTNWQEAMRCLVARQMQERVATEGLGALVLPTLHGEPYLAKPPVVYWCELALARLTGLFGDGQVSELHLRLTAAIAGTLGVILTFVLARKLFRVWPRSSSVDSAGLVEDAAREEMADHAAWWAGLFLVGGVLYVRSSRIGELDILLVPSTLLALLGVVKSWRHALVTGRTHVLWVVVAALATVVAALTKGPPALLTIALACYAGPLAWAATRPERSGPDPRRSRGWAAFWTMSKTHPVGVLGAGALALWGWSALVKERIGQAKLSALVGEEATDNLRLFVPEAPVNNLEAMAFGVGLGSAAALIAVIWLLKDRKKLGGWWTPGWMVVVAWILTSFVAFSVLGKGVPRYLTPMWPALAMLGGLWMAFAVRDFRGLRRSAGVIAGAAALLAIGQGVWYGFLMERYLPARSPRAMVREIRATPGASDARLYAFEFWTPAVDFYAGARVPGVVIGDQTPRPGLRYVGPETLADVRTAVEKGERVVMLLRLTQAPGMADETAEACLKKAGFRLERIPLASKFITDNNRVEVGAFKITR